jgi:hypothetical protein
MTQSAEELEHLISNCLKHARLGRRKLIPFGTDEASNALRAAQPPSPTPDVVPFSHWSRLPARMIRMRMRSRSFRAANCCANLYIAQ